MPHFAPSGLKTVTDYGGSGVRLFTNPSVFAENNIHRLWGLQGVHSGQTFQKSAFVEKGHMCHVYKYMYKGVETYLKNSTPPEEDEGRSGHWKSFKTQIDKRSKYSLLQMSSHTYKLLREIDLQSYLARNYNYKYQNANSNWEQKYRNSKNLTWQGREQ